MNIIEKLRLSDTLSPLPESELRFLADCGKVIELEKGDSLFRKDDAADEAYFILSGKIRVFLEQNAEKREVALLVPGDISGVLPYSRMVKATGFGVAVDASTVLAVHRNCFREMINQHPELTEALVHFMASRIRTFTAMRMQNEKLISLGKLSAGLAHELNNPAAAMVRSSEALISHLHLVPDNFKMVMKAEIKPEIVDVVNAWLFDIIENPKAKLTLMQRNKVQDELGDYLDDLNFTNAYELAETLVDHGIYLNDVETMRSHTGEKGFQPTLRWVISNLTTEQLVSEIRDSAQRIAGLIHSIKEYSHMDRINDRQLVNLNDGMRSTLRMLHHKVKSSKVVVDDQLNDTIPMISGFPGELNQVWTNIIDNALDAMDEQGGGTLIVKTEWCEPFVKIYIEDSGPGIPEEIQTRIFDPFFTTKKIGKGTGLGLDIVNKILVQHRADVQVNSKPGSTIFEISIPAVEAI
jgi:signal transduction histidine kinase